MAAPTPPDLPSLQPTVRTPPPADGTSLTGVLAVAQDLSPAELAALLRADQFKRWQRGERLPLEAYLEQLPALRDSDDALLSLVSGEVLLRESLGESPSWEEYEQRFPRHADLLRRVFALHQVEEAPDASSDPALKTPSPSMLLPPGAPGGTPAPARPKEDGRAELPPTVVAAASGATPPLGSAPPGRPADARRVPGYVLLGELGRGGMGVVYKAWQTELKRLVALKMILPGADPDPDQLARFRVEAEAVARLQHPNIVQIYEVGEAEGNPFFSLEYVEGGSLASRLDGSPRPAAEAARLVETLARAMQAAHEKGIVHRDLKPANILLAACGLAPNAKPQAAEAVPKITDFGLAKRIDTDVGQTRSGVVMGTPSYMAPEQAAGRSSQIGPAADVYALGAILYELLVGRPPFRAETLLDTLQQVLRDEPVPVRRLQPKVPRDLETICLKALAKEPARRYASALALAEDLRRFQAREPILARPAGPWERAAKWARRRPWTAATAVLIVLTAGSGSGALFANQQRKVARAEAGEQQARAETRQAVVRTECQAGLHAADDALLAHRDGAAAKSEAEKVLGLIKGAPAPELLDDLRGEAERRLARAEQLLHAVNTHRTFLRRRDDVLLHLTPFTGLDGPADARATAEAARAALDVVGVTLDGAADPPLDPLLTDKERAEINTGCYEILLLWAGTAAGSSPKEALRILDRAAKLGPETPSYHLRRAVALGQLGDAAAAGKARDAARACPNVTPVDYLLRGNALYVTGDRDGAAAAFRAALRLQPDYFWARFCLAVCDLQERPAQAEVGLTACLQQSPDSPWVLIARAIANAELSRFDQAEDDFARAGKLRLTDFARYSIAVNHGVMRQRQGQPEEAVADFRRAIELFPRTYNAYANLAQAYEDQRAWDKAVAEIDRAIALAPKVGSLYRLRARLLRERKDRPDPAGALRSLDEAIKCEPPGSKGLASCHRERGLLLLQAGKYADALRDYDAALDVNPKDAEAHYRRGEILLEQKDYKGAAAAFDRCLANGKRSADVYRLRARARVQLGDHAGAADDCTRALDLQDDNARLHTIRGWTYLQEASQLARRDFEEAMRLDPSSGEPYAGRGYLRALLGEHREAVKDAEEALRRGPRSAPLLLSAARIYARAFGRLSAEGPPADRPALELRLGYQEQAVRLLRQALDVLPARERPAFWKDAIAGDPALAPIRQAADYQRMERSYTRPGP